MKYAMTINEAQDLCENSQHFVGKCLSSEKGDLHIEHVAVSPADDINKWIFLQRFIETGDTSRSLDFYQVPFFDVILIGRDATNAITYRELKDYATAK